MPFADPITLTELRTAFDAQTATITANKRLGQKDNEPSLRLATLADTTALLSRSIAWTQQSDQELRTMFLRVTDGTAGRVITATLTVDDIEDRADMWLLDQTFSVSVTTINGTTQASLDVRTTTGKRVRLLSGVRYRLDIANANAATTVSGPIEAGVQKRSTRRGGASGPALVPRAFRNLGNFPLDGINANLLAITGDLGDSQAQRYTYGTAFFDLSGMAAADVTKLRQVAIRRVGADNGIEVCGLELVVSNATAASTWALTKVGDTTFPTMTVTGGGADVEDFVVSNVPAGVTSSAADLVYQITGSAGSITRGYLVVHTRADRWSQGSTLTAPSTDLFNSATSTAAATLQAVTDAFAALVAADAAADVDLRCECFVVRALASGSSRTFRLPSGARRLLGTVAYIVAGVGSIATWTVTGTGLSGASNAVTGTGTGNLVAGTDAASGTMNDDPTDSADDATVTVTISGGVTADLSYIWVFWS